MLFDHRIEPKIIRPFDENTLQDLVRHVSEIRRAFDWPGIPYHDAHLPIERRFNRWHWHNLPLIRHLHDSSALWAIACEAFGQIVKPSYSFLSMYGPDGLCPLHIDRPQCQFTIDLLLSGGEGWPLYIEDVPYVLVPGEAICYSGTGQRHYRKPMTEEGTAKSANLAFFHWVPEDWTGDLD